MPLSHLESPRTGRYRPRYAMRPYIAYGMPRHGPRISLHPPICRCRIWNPPDGALPTALRDAAVHSLRHAAARAAVGYLANRKNIPPSSAGLWSGTACGFLQHTGRFIQVTVNFSMVFPSCRYEKPSSSGFPNRHLHGHPCVPNPISRPHSVYGKRRGGHAFPSPGTAVATTIPFCSAGLLQNGGHAGHTNFCLFFAFF